MLPFPRKKKILRERVAMVESESVSTAAIYETMPPQQQQSFNNNNENAAVETDQVNDSNNAPTRSHSLTMEDVASWIREQDADLLESIQLSGPNASGLTPMLAGLTADDAANNSTYTEDGALFSLSHSKLQDDCNGDYNAAAATPNTTPHHMTNIETSLLTDSSSVLPKCAVRRALSGEVWGEPEDLQMQNHLPQTAPATATSSDTSLLEHAIENGAENGCVDVNMMDRGVLKRTESLDRRMNEAAQFAEAVGELLPSDQNELRIIEEDDDERDYDDDDDDNATEIHVSRAGDPGTVDVAVVALDDDGHHRLTVANTTRKTRPQWPFKLIGTKRGFLDKLPDDQVNATQPYEYKGIRFNPPEIVQSGMHRGNYAQLHRKAWLEVSDKYHRYGKNLRLYYRYWEKLGCPTNMFFDWLDSKGEAAGQPLPELEECPRSQLDADTVLYITNPDVSRGYALQVIPDETTGRGKVVDVDGDPVVTGSDGWIFVLRDNVIYGAQKITSVSGLSKQRFHHSSFFGGKAVAAAGILITDDDGYLTRLYPHSGHYRPGEAHVQRMLFFLHHEGVDLRTFEMDTQQILHVARDADAPAGDKAEKKKKTESLCLVTAVLVACFLAHKARFIGEGIFAQIHSIRKADVTTVGEALDAIDNGGCWKGKAPPESE